MDDGWQADAPDDCYAPPSNYRKRSGGNKGLRAEQQRRYRRKYPHKYRDYMRRYMAARRKLLNDTKNS